MSKGNLKGWKGISNRDGEFVDAEDGFEYVCEAVGIKAFDKTAPDAEEFKEMLIEWYFSGNWIEVYEEGEEL